MIIHIGKSPHTDTKDRLDMMSSRAQLIIYHSQRIIFSILCLLFSVSPAHAQSPPPTIIHNNANLDFPNTVTFALELDADIRQATLVYDTPQTTCLDVASRVPVEGNGRSLTWTWVMSRSGNPPPGAALWWEWEVTLSDGRTFTTPRQNLNFSDGRFPWRTLSADGLTLHWYAGDDIGPLLLDAATTGLHTLEQDMGISLQSEVQFYIYANAADMRDAVLYIQDWAGGVAFSEYNIILMGVPPEIAADWGQRTVRHELAHLVVGQFAHSCVGGFRPTWLEEGLAMVAEGDPDADLTDNLARAQADNSFFPVRSLNAPFPSHDTAANLAYSQSDSLVRFLLAEYGREKLQQLLLTLADGANYDTALEQVYGFNIDGLELAWRDEMGLPARPILPTPTPLSAAAVPTIRPQGMPQSQPTPPAAAAAPPEMSTPGFSICGINLLIPLLLFLGINRRKLITDTALTWISQNKA